MDGWMDPLQHSPCARKNSRWAPCIVGNPTVFKLTEIICDVVSPLRRYVVWLGQCCHFSNLHSDSGRPFSSEAGNIMLHHATYNDITGPVRGRPSGGANTKTVISQCQRSFHFEPSFWHGHGRMPALPVVENLQEELKEKLHRHSPCLPARETTYNYVNSKRNITQDTLMNSKLLEMNKICGLPWESL